MNTLRVKICGPRASGKTILMNRIKRMLTAEDIHYEGEICEDIDTENLTVRLSKNDLAALAQG